MRIKIKKYKYYTGACATKAPVVAREHLSLPNLSLPRLCLWAPASRLISIAVPLHQNPIVTWVPLHQNIIPPLSWGAFSGITDREIDDSSGCYASFLLFFSKIHYVEYLEGPTSPKHTDVSPENWLFSRGRPPIFNRKCEYEMTHSTKTKTQKSAHFLTP